MADITYYTHSITIYTIEKCGERKPTWNTEGVDTTWVSTDEFSPGTYRAAGSERYDIETSAFSPFPTDIKGQCFKIHITSVESKTITDLDDPYTDGSHPWPRYTWDDDHGVTHKFGEIDLTPHDDDTEPYYETTEDGNLSVWDCCPRKNYIDITTGKCATFMKTSEQFTGGDDATECESHGDPVETDLEPRCVPDCPTQMKGLSQYSWSCGDQRKILEALWNNGRYEEEGPNVGLLEAIGAYDSNGYVLAAKYGTSYLDPYGCCWPNPTCETTPELPSLGESTETQIPIDHELDPLGVGCGEDVLYPIPTTSATEDLNIARFVMGLPEINLASSMPVCQMTVPTSTETEDLCGQVIQCQGPPPPEPPPPEDCYDPCNPSDKAKEGHKTGEIELCPEAMSAEPCDCPKTSPGFASGGCDPHICTFFGETYEM